MTLDLYPRWLGPAWHDLAESVRRMHRDGADVRGVGRFVVRHGSARLARCLLWLTRMPPEGDDVAVTLVITREGQGERWERSFGSWPLASTQRTWGAGRLAERFGLLELRFQLEVADGALVYQQVGAALCLGSVRVPLPRWVAPRVAAREAPGKLPNHTQVSVQVSSPLCGLLISYEGTLLGAETPA